MYKNVHHITILVVVFAVFASCNSEAAQQQKRTEAETNARVENRSANSNGDTIRYHFRKDPNNGMVQLKFPIPASWVVSENPDAEIYIKGPNGITVSKPRTENYAYSNDPYMLQTIRMTGKQISPVLSLEMIVHQHIKPGAEAQGDTFIKSYPLPGVIKFWERFSAGMPQTGSQRQYNALGTEWKDGNGNNSFIIIVQSITTKNSAISWFIQTTELEAPNAHFEQARKAYVHAVINTEINPQWQQAMNGKLMSQMRRNDAFWAQKSRESARAHQQRMAAIESWGNTSRSISKTYSEISDISHAGYLKRSDIKSQGHAKTVNLIGERAVIGNHNTGEHYTVDAGSKYYWVNNNGQYFGTDNANYDPRIDNKINDTQWTQFDVEQ